MTSCTKTKNMLMNSADKKAVLLSNRIIEGSVFRNIWAIVIYWLFIDLPGQCKYSESREKSQACLSFSEAHPILFKYNQNHSLTKQRSKLNGLRIIFPAAR